jgi:hypothetical protein
MANRRNSRGQFVGRGGSSRRRAPRRGRKGMGSVYAIKRSGMGALSADAFKESILPILVGGGLAGGTLFAIRKWLAPNGDATKQAVVKYAPLAGAGVGAIGALSLKWLADSDDAAVGGLVAAAVVGGLGMVMDMVAPGAITPAEPLAGYLGMGAIVPEYGSMNGMGAIVMQPSANGRRPGSIGSYGETVNLSGINTSVFGTPGF